MIDFTQIITYLVFWNTLCNVLYMYMVEVIVFKRQFGCQTSRTHQCMYMIQNCLPKTHKLPCLHCIRVAIDSSRTFDGICMLTRSKPTLDIGSRQVTLLNDSKTYKFASRPFFRSVNNPCSSLLIIKRSVDFEPAANVTHSTSQVQDTFRPKIFEVDI